MRIDRQHEPLSDEELEPFLQYLHRFARHGLDIFSLLKVGGPEYSCYVTLSRTPEAGVDSDAYRWP
ncbi:hypothetical protein ABT160_14700 [Streptomyces sp. NPDC001941]|uniref:hypothetical protein n=1 Tax=Streptomyces sp. NPDC001941 TaxID=3154659 RepID=UPI0033187506